MVEVERPGVRDGNHGNHTMCTIRFARLAIDSALISFRSRGRRERDGMEGLERSITSRFISVVLRRRLLALCFPAFVIAK